MRDSTRPKICFVAPNAFPLLSGDEAIPLIGGAELQQVIIAKGLSERGFTVSMICLDFGQGDEVEIDGVKVFKAFRPDDGIPIVRFIWPRLTSVLRCLKRANADIYYVRAAGMLTGIVAAFCRFHARSAVFAAAGNPDLEKNTPRIRFARDRKIYEFGLRHVDAILVQNEAQRQLCLANFGRDSIIIPNAYPILTGDHSGGGGCVLWVATIRKLKRPDIFLDLAAALPEYQFKMIGGAATGELALFESVKARAGALNNVQFLGFVPFSKVEKHFSKASIFVNTSESEGFPNTFLQAWARGVPTVSFVDSGARQGGQTVGRLVHSITQMAEYIEYCMESESERRQEGIRCREYFEMNHSPDRVLDLYERLIAGLEDKGIE